MKTPAGGAIVTLLLLLLPTSPLLLILLIPTVGAGSDGGDPSPAPWPERFHAVLYMNLSSGRLQISDLWYDWPAGRNVNLMQKQLGPLLHDVEWDNGTSYYYTLGPARTCRTEHFGVGIPRPDFMDGSVYLGRRHTDGFLCDVWEKVEFIWYYEDVASRRPVRWDFYDGISTHVMTFEVGPVLDQSQWQAPSYCFSDDDDQEPFERIGYEMIRSSLSNNFGIDPMNDDNHDTS